MPLFCVLHALPLLPRNLFLAGIVSLVGARKVGFALCVIPRRRIIDLPTAVAGVVTVSISADLVTCHTLQMRLICASLAAQILSCGANVATPLKRLPLASVGIVMRLLRLVHIAIVLNHRGRSLGGLVRRISARYK